MPLLAVATVVAAFGAGVVGGTVGGQITHRSPAVDPQDVALTPVGYGDRSDVDVGAVVASLRDSVATISTQVQSRRGPYTSYGEGAGTGVVIDRAGHILTNAHVVEGATSVTVTVNGRSTSATVLGTDPRRDVAVLRVDDPTGMVPAPLASGSPAVGDTALAIGNALGLEGDPSVTRGIVSAVDRRIETSSGTLEGLIQTDAAISSGNSGGPLVNAAGQVIGINTAVATSTGQVQASNVGFAIAIDDARAVAESLIHRS